MVVRAASLCENVVQASWPLRKEKRGEANQASAHSATEAGCEPAEKKQKFSAWRRRTEWLTNYLVFSDEIPLCCCSKGKS